jgi:hypothetical protein
VQFPFGIITKHLSSETTKRENLFLLLLFVAATVAYFWARNVQVPLLRAPDGHYVLVDSDSMMRWRLVDRALGGDGVRIHWITEDNAPYGRLNGWTSPMSVLGVTIVRLGELLGGMSRPQALEWGGLWLGPIVGLVGMAALGFLGWRAGGWLLAACWLVAWPVLIDVMVITAFGNTDHHSLHQLLFICIVAGCLASARKPTCGWGIFVGLATAVAIWSAGSEMMPACGLVGGLALYELGWKTADEAHKQFWRAWWISGLLGTMAAWLFEFWPHVFHGDLELISVWHVALWAIGGGLLEVVNCPRMPRGLKILAIVAAVGLAGLAAAATRGFDWRHLHVMQDVRLKRLMSITAECLPYPHNFSLAVRHGYIDFGFLPFLSLGLLFSFKKLDARSRWALLATGCYLLLTFLQVRWMDFLIPLLVITAGLAVTNLWNNSPEICLACMVVATIPAWLINMQVSRNVKLIGGDPLRGPQVETFALRALSDCLGDSRRQPIVLAPWDESSFLAPMGKVRVMGTGFWSNLDGLNDTSEMFTTPSVNRFWELQRKRNVEFLLLRSPAELEEDVRLSFVLLTGQPPSQTDMAAAYVWQILKDDRFPVVTCEQMLPFEPLWKVIHLSSATPSPGGG